ncbi:MAG: molybdenum cofactor guanylyltransferase [Acidobacteria bacterium]|nr:molybdenum cofactor guanylyltransferase [Acidobacteriota bacterium]
MRIIFSAAILAGGRARRLGGLDKSALRVGARSIFERQLSLLRGLTPHLLIVGGPEAREQAAGVPVVADRIAGAGSLGGLYTALMDAPTDQVLVVACDMPFLDAPFLAHLAARGTDVDAAMPRDDRGRHPFCASYSRRIAGHLRACIERGDLRVGAALAAVEVRELGPGELAPFDPDGLLLLNVNTQDDYERACRLAAEHEGPRRTGSEPPTS